MTRPTRRILGPGFARVDPLEMTVSPKDRLRWALIEQGYDPRLFDVADDFIRPGTVVVRAPLGNATPGLRAVWWDEEAGKATGPPEAGKAKILHLYACPVSWRLYWSSHSLTNCCQLSCASSFLPN